MEELKSNFRWVVLGILFLIILFATISMNCIPPLFKEIGEQVPLTKSQMGTVMGVLGLASLFFAIIGGGISDRIGAKWGLGAAALIIAIMGALRANVGSANGLITFMFLLGAGMAVMGPNMPKALGMWFPPKELAFANGLCISGMGLGGAIAMATSASVLSPALGGWRSVMVVVGAVVFVLGILWIFIYRDKGTVQKSEKEKPNILENFKKVFRVKDVWLLSMFYGLNMVGLMAVITFLPVSLEERGVARAGELVGLMMGVTVVFNILGGILSDRFGKRKPFLIICAVVLGLAILTLNTVTGVALIIALVIAGAALGTIAPVVMTIPLELKEIGHTLAATAMGLIFMIGNTGGFVGPVVSGKLMDLTGSQGAGFIFMAAALIVAAGFAIPMRETGSKKKPGEAPSAPSH
jgi:cyanate permease